MDRPLWQILLAMLLVGFAAQRAAAGLVLQEGGVAPSLFLAVGAMLVTVALFGARPRASNPAEPGRGRRA